MRGLWLAITSALWFVACGATPPAPITGSADGAWSNPATWGGKLPDGNSAVTIPAGKTITLDSSVAVRSITVNGTLQWADADNLELKTGWVMVESSGVFRVGSAEKPFTKRATITLTGSDTNENVMGMGTKFLGAMGGGKLEIFGEDRLPWTKLNASVTAGGSSLALKDSVPWRVGERVVIASSSLDPDEAEERGIKSISADGKTLTLDAPLTHAHFGQVQTFEGKTLDARAEVGLLSRNIVQTHGAVQPLGTLPDALSPDA
jgi:G8 domain